MPATVTRRSWTPLLGATALALLILGVAAIALLVVNRDSASTPSGVVVAQSRSVPAFSGVELRGVGVVSVKAGRTRSVVVRADRNVIQRVTTRVRGGVLVIGIEGHDRAASDLHALVSTPRLQRLTLSGSGEIDATGARGRQMQVVVAGAGLVRASGAVERLDVLLSGVGDARLGNLRARAVDARIAGTGRMVVHPLRTLDAAIAGTGEILYRGDPAQVRSSVMGTGTITRSPGPSG